MRAFQRFSPAAFVPWRCLPAAEPCCGWCSIAAESLPKQSSHPNIVWAGTPASAQQGPAWAEAAPRSLHALCREESGAKWHVLWELCTAQGQRGGSPGGTEPMTPCRSQLGLGSYHSVIIE